MLFLNAGKRMAFMAFCESLTRGLSPAAIPLVAFSLLPHFRPQRVRNVRHGL